MVKVQFLDQLSLDENWSKEPMLQCFERFGVTIATNERLEKSAIF